ncbi:hypothetical protein B0H16DRAFT_1834145 [Mycena metata]|uniref:Uncharacterized protein n=1 Tax=Mycena metata TaxID=1033252 RepID=A0AAD7NCD6_9AGAR|nr:hypothetical protein B0H16DRAFT_1834145 [Mycena metata]
MCLRSPHLPCGYFNFLQLAPKFPSTFTLLDVLHAGDHCSSRVQLLLSTGLSEILLVEEQQLSLRMSISKALQQIRRMSTLLPDTLESEVFKDTLARLENQRIWLNNSRSLRQCISSFRKIVPLLSRGLQLLQQDYARYPPPVEFDRSIPSSQTGSSTTTGVEPVEPPQFLNAKSKSKPAAGASKKRKRKSGQSDDDASEFIPVNQSKKGKQPEKGQKRLENFLPPPSKAARVNKTDTAGSSSQQPSRNPPTTSQQQQLTNFAFTSTKPAPPTGVSSRLTTFGVPEKKLNEPTVDNSRYLWPSHIFPVLNDPMVQPEDAIEQTAMELTDVDFDPRDIVLNFGSCYLEILTIEDWIGVSRTPAKVKSIETSQLSTLSSAAKARMFRVVIAIEMGSHVLAWLSNDGNVRTYWLSLEDINIVKPFRVPEWGKFTANWLQTTGSAFDNHSVSSVLTMPGNQPSRGVGKYTRDEVLHLAGIPPYKRWGEVRKDGKEMSRIFVSIKQIMTRHSADTEYTFLIDFFRRSMQENAKHGPDSFMIMTSDEDIQRYSRDLAVHRQLEMSARTYIEAQNRAVNFFEPELETNMDDAPSMFDIADVAEAVVHWGSLGPLLLGDDWEKWSTQKAVVTDAMENFNSHLPHDLTDVQRLSLKPLPDLTADEIDFLVKERGDTVNPLVRYLTSNKVAPSAFGAIDFSSEDEDSDYEPVSERKKNINVTPVEMEVDEEPFVQNADLNPLIKDPTRVPIPTKAYKSVDGTVWTVLAAPFSTTTPDPSMSPPNALVFKEVPDSERRKSTIKFIKQHTRKYTVGPLDFTGHAKLVRYGGGLIVVPCFWHPSMTPKEQEFV